MVPKTFCHISLLTGGLLFLDRAKTYSGPYLGGRYMRMLAHGGTNYALIKFMH